MTTSRSFLRSSTANVHATATAHRSGLRRPVTPSPRDTRLDDERTARILVAAAFPPLRGDAAALFVPALDGRPTDGVLCVVDDLPERPAHADVETCIGVFAQAVTHASPGEPGLLVAFQRRGESGPRETDTIWVPAARKVCAHHNVRLLGVWLVAGRDEPLRLDA